MGKAIRIECRQTMANYRKPPSFIIKETYPLPPYSTVIGMVHKACGFENYHSMEVSVQGSCCATVADLYTKYAFGNSTYDEERHSFFVKQGDKKLGVFKGIANTELLTEIKLILHIVPQEEDFETVLHRLRYPDIYPSLGRYEDLLDIEKVEAVSLDKKKMNECRYDAYVPLDQLDEDDEDNLATVYRINKEFVIDPKTKFRRWKKVVPVKHVCKGFLATDVFVDDYGDSVFLV